MIGIKPNVRLEIRDRDGNLLEVIRVKNTVVDTGLAHARDLYGGNGLRPDEIALGTGTTTPAASDTALESEEYRKTIERRTRETKKIAFQILLGTGDGNGYTYSEIGLFEQTTMLARALISPAITKTAAIQLTAVHELSFTNV